MKASLLQDRVVKELSGVKSLEEFIEIMEESSYRKSFVEASQKKSGLGLVELALKKDVEKSLKKLWRIVPRDDKNFFAILCRHYDAQNLKLVFTMKLFGKPVGRDDLVFATGESEALFGKLVDCDSLDKMVPVLAQTEWAKVGELGLAEFKQTGSLEKFFASVDDLHYRELSKALKELKEAGVLMLVKEKLFFSDFMLLLRLRKGGVQDDGKLFYSRLPASLLRMSYPELCSFAKNELGVSETDSRDASLIEAALEKRLNKRIGRAFSLSVLCFGSLASFFYLKETEVAKIRRVAYAVAYGWQDELQELAA
jgi:vacuolar-type H+-ATPase subunit C/Vma6